MTKAASQKMHSRAIVNVFQSAYSGIGKEFYNMIKSYLAATLLLSAAAMTAQPLGMPKLFAPADAPEVSNEIIYEAPEGKTSFYNETYVGWVFWGSEMGLFYNSGNRAINQMVWTDDSKVYILNPVKNYTTDSYAVGTYAEGKITVELPQCIGGYYDEAGEIAYMYLNKLEEVEQDGEKYYMICYPEDNYLIYDVDEEGNVTLNLGNDAEAVDIENGVNPKYLVGMTYENEPHALQVWSGFGDSFESWELIPDEEPVTPPADLASDFWAFDTNGSKSLLEVRIDGSDIYLNGFTSYIEGYWIKGTLTKEKEIVIPTQQFMGKNEFDQFYYFLATKIVPPEDENGWNTYEMIDQITMTYDPETKVYSAPGEAFCVSSNRDYVAYMALAENPMLWEQDPATLNAAPNNPYVSAFYTFNPETISGMISWEIPNVNVNGALLRTDKMYYNMYVDGELFTFEPDEYPLFSEPTIDVPYNVGNYYDISVYRQNHTITFKFEDPASFGLQSFYIGDDVVVYSSEIVTFDVATVGVSSTEIPKEVKEVTFYNMSGVVISLPSNGIYIKRTVYTDGTQSIEKINYIAR